MTPAWEAVPVPEGVDRDLWIRERALAAAARVAKGGDSAVSVLYDARSFEGYLRGVE